MSDRDLEAVCRLFTRLISSNPVPHWDFEQIRREVGAWDDWCEVWRRWARRHARFGEVEAPRPATTVVFPVGVHVCNNLW
jgi:hypothetical protein